HFDGTGLSKCFSPGSAHWIVSSSFPLMKMEIVTGPVSRNVDSATLKSTFKFKCSMLSRKNRNSGRLRAQRHEPASADSLQSFTMYASALGSDMFTKCPKGLGSFPPRGLRCTGGA